MSDCVLPFGKLIMLLMLLLLLLMLAERPGRTIPWLAMATDATDDVPTNCLEHTVTSGTFDQYYGLADIGNEPSDSYLLNVSLTVEVRNRQEELAILLSGQNRSYQHPDFARTYEMRMTNVYTVMYRETFKMQSYHSPTDKLFPADRFRLRLLLSRDGNLTVLVNDGLRRPLIAVIDARQALDVQYASFSSRMNAYPIRFYLGCGLPQYRPVQVIAAGEEGSPSSLPLTDGSSCPICPVCPKQRCEVVVKACADSSKDANNGSSANEDLERQKYYFYFNLYLMKNRTKTNVQANRKTTEDGL